MTSLGWINVYQIALLLCLSSLTGGNLWSIPQFNFLQTQQLFIIGTRPLCQTIQGLDYQQRYLCKTRRDHMGSIGLGAKLAAEECQYQFRNHRWNCTISDSSSMFVRLNHKYFASRESAFTYAISSAAVVHAISRACMEGNLSSCGCSRSRRPKKLNKEYSWGGCGDNIVYGLKFGKKFMDSTENLASSINDTRKTQRILTHLHNNEVGRKAVADKMNVSCKCHGVSGSCRVQTCWRQLSPFRGIGIYLKEQYENAKRVHLVKKKRQRHMLLLKNGRKPKPNDMVYTDDSPDYCERNVEMGSLGTQGRKCNKTSLYPDSCNFLCCGRGFNKNLMEQISRCGCKFYWCCHVKCKKCAQKVNVYTCK